MIYDSLIWQQKQPSFSKMDAFAKARRTKYYTDLLKSSAKGPTSQNIQDQIHIGENDLDRISEVNAETGPQTQMLVSKRETNDL